MCHLVEVVFQSFLSDHKYTHLFTMGDQGGNSTPNWMYLVRNKMSTLFMNVDDIDEATDWMLKDNALMCHFTNKDKLMKKPLVKDEEAAHL